MSSNTIQQRFLKTELVKWREILPLQPTNFKLRYNDGYLEASHDKYGIVEVLEVWQDESNGDIYALDGHGRIEHYHTREDMPEEIHANFYRAKDKEEAILILMEVFNQKLNPIDQQVMVEWMEVEQIAVEEIALQSLNMVAVGDDVDYSERNKEIDVDDFADTMTLKLEYSSDDYEKVKTALAERGQTAEKVLFDALNLSDFD